MTESEAIEMLQDWNKDLSIMDDEKDGIECHELAIKALEKQIPKQIVTKVQSEDLKVGHVTFKAGTKTYYCPTCNRAITLAGSFCGWCGQAVILGADK